MNFYKSHFHSLKTFTHIIHSRIPLKVKIVAELRLIWEDIVGEKMALRSQPGICEYIPKKNNPHKFYRRLIIWVSDTSTKIAMTEYTAEYLDKIPRQYKIHSLRIQLLIKKEMIFLEKKKVPQAPILHITKEEKQLIRQKVENTNISHELKEQVFHFLCLCKSQYNQKL